ncbi:hypothetical protein J2W32_003710 [Variovorax boronicumulans]|uniref:Uncharacterized protein n=1 Tax=Variovorax boronicumulans TaxID=436515 RepID=A0AAW8CX48_9BURK|nr:hypothetical protein [Variovorax boronicumulans]MDP9895029.1 hypothetical protein [Variovorax boronicumulans]MDP9993986.1 hypothetical protein [Variovorax boronicumulans]MDQ0005151.1 hypothetical protein [Variovorax boronicumulans]MDQ0038522.1 hypothetical protein [Variovorax boronicumulans]MDQ0044686.1 hypothetical protein [Variovorax boronicumulans]
MERENDRQQELIDSIDNVEQTAEDSGASHSARQWSSAIRSDG